MKKTLSCFALLVLGIGLTCAASAQPSPLFPSAGDCRNLVFNHSYSQQFEGLLNVPVYYGGGPPGIGIVPNAGAGFLTFHQGGKVSGQITIAIGLLGLFPDLVLDNTSEYSLSWDTSKTPAVCSGTLAVNTAIGSFHFQLLVSQDGQQIETIHTDTGLIVGVTGYPVKTSGCNNNTLDGKYSYNIKGWGMAPPGSYPPEQLLAGYFPFAFSGAMEFHSRGNSIDFWDTVSLNGTILPRTGSGSYTVNPNCTGALILKDNSTGQEFHLELFVGKSGKAVYVVNVDTVTIPGSPQPVPLFLVGASMNRVD